MVLGSPDEARRQRILIRRQQALQENNERDIAELEHHNMCDTQDESKEKTPTVTEEQKEIVTDNKKRELDIPDDATIVANVYQFLKQEYQFMKLWNTDGCYLRPLAAIKRRTISATGLPGYYVDRVLRQDRLRMENNKRMRNARQRALQNLASTTQANDQED